MISNAWRSNRSCSSAESLCSATWKVEESFHFQQREHLTRLEEDQISQP